MKKRSRKSGLIRKINSSRSKVRSRAKSGNRIEGRAESEAPSTIEKTPLIVGVGASAGGLEAFTQLLRALPVNTGMAFVLLQHLEPRHESMLTRLLARATKMPVQEVRDGMRIAPNHVYVIPANADLSLTDGELQVVARSAPAGHHLPVDYFFRSLAETQKSKAIGVILSGTASDGTAGLRAIKTEGGITFAQEPASARFDGMPRNAIAAGCVDLVLTPERIASELARIARHPLVALVPLEPEGAVEALPSNEEDWAHLFRLLRSASGVDFSFYKKSTIKRRLARRMTLLKVETLKEYLKYADRHREELDTLFQEILIHVTGFFRDPEVFVALRGKVFPELLKNRAQGEPVRLWVAGCSTGEEVYSIAICLLEHLGDHVSGTPIQIFGTDINEVAVEKARAGVYTAEEARDVSAERKRRFFTQVEGNYTVNSSLREMCVFARHDLTKDPPFSKLDLLSCRNVLIYLEPLLQKRVLASFHYALKHTGVLLLGRSESLGAYADLFTAVDRRNKFFSKNVSGGEPLEVAQARFERLTQPGIRPKLEAPRRLDLEKEADRIVWERYAHAGIVVNNDLQILHFRGDTSSYLQPAPGKATFNLMRMLREELQLELRAAFQEARKSGHSVRREAIAVKQGRQTRTVNLEITPLPGSGDGGKCYLILFEEAAPREIPAMRTGTIRRLGKAAPGRELSKLENELVRTREYLQAVIREQESTNEELKTANEEALSSMEELQSTNEELETAKEELQSSNEELVTLNEQLQNRNAELSRLSDDLSNVISGVDIPILILDSERCIRRFTPSAQKLLGLLAGDLGRSIDNLRVGINLPELKELVASVMEKGEVGREVRTENGHWYWLRIRPFRTAEQKVEGVLMAFVDIDELKKNQQALQAERNLLSTVLDAARDLLVVITDREGRVIRFNRVCQELTGYSAEEAEGQIVWDFLAAPEESKTVQETFKEVLQGKPTQSENHWITKDGRRLLIGWSRIAVAADGAVESVIGSGIDHTERAESRLRIAESEATVRALLETAAQAILAVDQRGRIVLVNAATEAMFGYSRDLLIGHPVANLIPERFRERHARHLAKWFEQPRARQMGIGMELAGLRKDGTEFPVEVSLSYISSGDGVLGVGFVSDISERKRNEEALRNYQWQLQRLTGNLLTVQEAENRELARELHDVYSQELAALNLEVSTLLASRQVAGPLTQTLADLGKKIGHLADEMHRTSRQIHPAIVHELGLEAALGEESNRASQQLKIPVEFICERLPASLPEEAALCLYRVGQESLRNIGKHSGATEVQVQLRGSGEGVQLSIHDTGDGFDVAEARKKGGLGLISMEERVRLVNGKFDIRSQPGVGTTVEVFVPLK